MPRLEAYAKPGTAEKWAKSFEKEGWLEQGGRAAGERRFIHPLGATARIFGDLRTDKLAENTHDGARADFVAVYPDSRGRYPDPCPKILGAAAEADYEGELEADPAAADDPASSSSKKTSRSKADDAE